MEHSAAAVTEDEVGAAAVVTACVAVCANAAAAGSA